MCRMAIMFGPSTAIALSYSRILEALIRSSSEDPYGKALYGEEHHSDGWGILMVSTSQAGMKVMYWRSVDPLFTDQWVEAMKPIGVEGSYTLIMMHARAASTNTPINVFSTHPVMSLTRSGYELFMIHNGSFNKDALLKDLEIAGIARNDTYLANVLLSRIVDSEVTKDALMKLFTYIKTGANLGIVLVKDNEAQLVVGSMFKALNDGKDEVREKYYRLYQCVDGKVTVYSSSTLVDVYGLSRDYSCKPLKNGEYHSYIISQRGIRNSGVWVFNP